MKLVSFLNLGNTCYFNSVLQAFITDPLFYNKMGSYTTEDSFVKEIATILSFVDFSFEKEECKVLNNGALFDFFKLNKLEPFDAYEFYVLFLELLIKKTPSKLVIKSHYNDSWKNFITKNGSIFTKMYYGQLKTTVVCNNCGFASESFEEFNCIILQVEDKKTVSQLVMKFFSPEEISYCCEKCNCSGLSKKKTTFNIVPKRLVFVLKCYTQHSKTYFETVVDSFKIKDSVYNPMSIINHSGNLHDGHYTSTHNINGNKVVINDHVIFKSKKYQDPYMIFYGN